MYCGDGFITMVEVSFTLHVTGDFGSSDAFSSRDTALLEEELSQLFPVDLKTTCMITSIQRSSPSLFVVQLKTTAIADDEVDAMLAEMKNALNSFLNDGSLMSALRMGAAGKMLSVEDGPWRSAKEVSLWSLNVLNVHNHARGNNPVQVDAKVSFQDESVSGDDNDYGHTKQARLSSSVVIACTFALVAVAVVVVVILAIARTSIQSNDFDLLPDSSHHSRA